MHKLIFYFLFFCLMGCKNDVYSGIGRALDGDNILINEATEIRLWGIDAPEYQQKCYSPSQEAEVGCGLKAQAFLDKLLSHTQISCSHEGTDRYNRILSICQTADGTEINKKLVAEGWALDYTQYSGARYRMAEYKAKRENKGLWQYQFDLPHIWRQNKRNNK